MTEATLSFDIDSAPAADAAGDLDRMTAAAKRAEDQALKTGRASEAYGKAVDRAIAPMTKTAGVQDQARKAADLLDRAQKQVTSSTGSMTDTVRAGSRSLEEMSLAQVAVNRALMGHGQVANTVRPAVVALVGAFGTLVTVAGLVGGAVLALGFRNLSKDAGNVAASLNLSTKQMERLKKSGEATGITLGDVLKGVSRTIQQNFGPQIDSMSKAWNGWLDELTTNTAREVKAIVGFFGGAVGAIKASWRLLPAALGDVAIQTTNAVISAVQKMINASADALNLFIQGASIATGNAAIGNLRLSHVNLDPIRNDYEGAGRSFLDAATEGWNSGQAEWIASAEKMWGDLGRNTVDAARERLRDKAGRATSDKHAESLRRELEAMRATTRGNYELAQAYLVSAEAAMRAQAVVDARGKAIRRQADIEAFVRAQLALNASEIARDAAKTIADLQAENKARAGLTLELEAGRISADQMNEALATEAALRPILAAANVVEGKQRRDLLDLYKAMRVERAENVKLIERERHATALRETSDQIAILEREVELLGASARERAIGLAVYQKELELRAANVPETDQRWLEQRDATSRLAAAQFDLGVRTEATNTSLRDQLDLWESIDARARNAAAGISDAFGQVGRSIGDVMTTLTGYSRLQEDIAYRRARDIDAAGENELRINQIVTRSDRESAEARIGFYSDVLAASKSAFSSQTFAFKALQAVEMGYRATQAVLAIRAMAAQRGETALTLAQNAIKAASHGVVAMASAMAGWPFPLNIAAMAATGAALVGIGVSAFGGGGGGASSITMPTTNTGTGTTLGDPTASSESLAKALSTAERYQDSDLGLSRGILASLRAIEGSIGALVTSLARQISGGAFDTSKLGLGTSTSGGFLGIGSTTRTSELAGRGLDLSSGSLASLIAQGVSGSLYQIVENTKQRSGFMGIGASTTKWLSESRSAMDADLSRQLGQVLASLRSGVLTAAGQLGLEGAEATLNAMQVSLGRIDFTDLSSSEISERLTQVFSAVGDTMALALLPQIEQFQQAGEGLMETLVRLATQVQSVDARLTALGMAVQVTGLEGIAARDRLVQMAGGLDAFLEQTEFFSENFLSEAQRLAPVQAFVTSELERMGLAADLSRQQFANLVMGLDVSSAAGAEMFSALMHLAPAFDQVASAAEDAAARQAEAALRIADQRRSLEIALMEAMGDTAGALAARRSDELDAMDSSLRSIQQQIWAAQDAAAAQAELARQQEAAARSAEQYRQTLLQQVEDARGKLAQAYERESSALQGVIDRFDGFATSLRALRDTLGEQLPGATSYEAQRAIFNRMAAQARQGDETALSGLQGAAEAYLQTARANAASQEAYLFDLARVRRGVTDAIGGAEAQKSVAEQQLGQLKDQVRHLIDLNENVLSVQQAIVDLHLAMRRAGVAAFAQGGVFTNGVVSTPTMAPMALFGEAGPEAIMPLVRGPDGLGVRASNDNRDTQALLAEVRALNERLDRIDANTAQGAVSANRASRSLDRIESRGVYVHGEQSGDPVTVQTAEDEAA